MHGTILTEIGKQKFLTATPEDQITISEIAVGDGGGAGNDVDPSMTALRNEVWRSAASAPIRNEDNPSVLTFETVIPGNIGGFTIREVGLYDENGDLIAAGVTSEIVKPTLSQSIGITLTMRVHIALDNAGDVELVVQDTGVVDHQSLNNRNKPNAHDASAIGFKQKGVGAVERTAKEKFEEWVSVKDYGAVGDGIADDRAAIINALEAADGRKVFLENGAIYKISSPLVYAESVSLETNGKSTIFFDGQVNGPLVHFIGTKVKDTSLAATIEINARDWNVSDTSGVEVGMLMEVISSKSWYHDPRPESTDARKSELHKVVKVEGNTITTELPANDGYTITNEMVAISFYRPISVRLKGVEIRAKKLPYGETARASTGLRIERCLDSVILDSHTKDAQACGLSITGCYNTWVKGGNYDGSNYYFTGYGIQTAGSTLTFIKGTKHFECRRGVDVSGAKVISLHTYVSECIATGGGYNSRGQVYGWDDKGAVGAPSFGFGTHGPADKTVFDSNIVERVHTPFNTRSRTTEFVNNKIYGRTRGGAFSLSYGSNCVIKDNWVEPSFFGGKDSQTLGGGNINSRMAENLITIHGTWQSSVEDPVIVQGNAFSCYGDAVVLNTDVTRLAWEGNTTRFRPSTGSTVSKLFVNATDSFMTTNMWFVDIGQVYKFGSGEWRVFDENMNAGTATVINGERGRFTPIIITPLGATPHEGAQEQLNYEVINGVVTIWGAVRINVTALEGDPLTFIIDKEGGLPYARRFVSSLQAHGSVSSPHLIGSCAARTSGGGANRIVGSATNLGASGDTYVRVQASYAIAGAVPFTG